MLYILCYNLEIIFKAAWAWWMNTFKIRKKRFPRSGKVPLVYQQFHTCFWPYVNLTASFKKKKVTECTWTLNKMSKQEFHFTIQSFLITRSVTIQCALLWCAKMLILKQEKVQKGVRWYMMSKRPANDVIDDTTLPL